MTKGQGRKVIVVKCFLSFMFFILCNYKYKGNTIFTNTKRFVIFSLFIHRQRLFNSHYNMFTMPLRRKYLYAIA